MTILPFSQIYVFFSERKLALFSKERRIIACRDIQINLRTSTIYDRLSKKINNRISVSLRKFNMRVVNPRLNYVMTLPNNKIELSTILHNSIINLGV